MAVMPSVLQIVYSSPRMRSAVAGSRTRNGLVGKQKRWLLNEGTCDADTLLLATGQLIGATQGKLDQPGTLDRVERKAFLRHWQREQGAQPGMITQASRQHVAQHRRTAD